MHLRKLTLADFRNFRRVPEGADDGRALRRPSVNSSSLVRASRCCTGHNGAGKTNLLEAIYLVFVDVALVSDLGPQGDASPRL